MSATSGGSDHVDPSEYPRLAALCPGRRRLFGWEFHCAIRLLALAKE